MSGCSSRVEFPLFQADDGGSNPAQPLQVRDISFARCSRRHADNLNRIWHSRLPRCEASMMSYAFHAYHADISYAVALWSTPVARLVPSHWIELRRMACSPEMPHNGASAFLGWMIRYFKKYAPHHERAVSYQDTAVHNGTIYKAAGWTVGRISGEGDSWDRKNRFRPMKNGEHTIASAKIRWERSLS